MIKVIFICYGNICRSPMAEYIFKDILKKENIADKFIVSSAATSRDAINEDIYLPIKNVLKDKQIAFSKHHARQFTLQDYQNYDYILCMEKTNIDDLNYIIGNDKDNKIYRLLDFTDNPKDIVDPWYYHNYEQTYQEIEKGCKLFLKELKY